MIFKGFSRGIKRLDAFSRSTLDQILEPIPLQKDSSKQTRVIPNNTEFTKEQELEELRKLVQIISNSKTDTKSQLNLIQKQEKNLRNSEQGTLPQPVFPFLTIYFRLVASPPRICRSDLLISRILFTMLYCVVFTYLSFTLKSLCTVLLLIPK